MNRETLAQQGILFPGPTWGRHARAVSDLIGSKHAQEGAWASLRDEINAHPGTAIVSMEYLGPIRAPRIAQLVGDFPDTDLRIVVTVRDLGRTVYWSPDPVALYGSVAGSRMDVTQIFR